MNIKADLTKALLKEISKELERLKYHAALGNVTAKTYVRDVTILLEIIEKKEE